MPQAEQLALVFLDGVAFSMLLFLLAAGLVLMLGVMNIVNLAHGSFYMLGGFVGIAVGVRTGDFALAVLAGMGAIGVLAFAMERFFLRRLPGNTEQVLFTLGCVYIIWDLSRIAWGSNPQLLSPPAFLAGSVPIGDYRFPVYQLAVIVLGALVALGLWFFVQKTRFGAIVRAGADDREMAAGLGIDIKLVFTAVFTLAGVLAGLAGVIGAPILTANLTLDWQILTLALVVMVVGGMRTIQGALVGSLVIGLVGTVGTFFLPQLSMFLVFAIMALVLAFRPRGLVR